MYFAASIIIATRLSDVPKQLVPAVFDKGGAAFGIYRAISPRDVFLVMMRIVNRR